jgi:hypothetical protein
MAAAAKDPSEKADFLEVERGWLSLALRYEGPSSPPKEHSLQSKANDYRRHIGSPAPVNAHPVNGSSGTVLHPMPGKMARSAAANEAMNLSHSSKLIYDVGMNNGDDTAYYLWCGFRVIAIEANPELAADVAQRFAHEIDAGRLTILNVGITAAEGEFTFWICKTNSKFSSFRSAPRLRGRP